MKNLHDALWDLAVEDLRYRLLFLTPGTKVTRKAEYIDGIKANLEGPALKAAWESLDETEQLAVAEAVHDPLHIHRPTQFQSKYRRAAEFHRRSPEQSRYSSWQSPKNATRLNLFFFRDRYTGEHMIPHDLASRLHPLVPVPAPATLQTIPAPTPGGELALRHTEPEALAELPTLLHLASLGNLRFGASTGIPSKVALNAINPLLANGDWFPPELIHIKDKKSWEQEIGPIKPIGWTRLLHAAGLIAMQGAKSTLTPAGRRAIQKPPHETICGIWQKWATNKLYDEFNRIDIIKGQTVKGSLTSRTSRRAVVLDAFEECPAGEWISFDGFSHYMRAEDHMFEVSDNPWKLYIGDRQYGALGYAGYGGWDVLQDRYLLCLLMEYAATIGLIDIAYGPPEGVRRVDNWGMDDYLWLSRYDGLTAFRINALGAYCLSGGTSTFTPSRPTPQVRLTVLTNRTIRVASGSPTPAERVQLETWAEPCDAATYRLDESRALDAVEAGHNPATFAEFLRERDDQPIPETVEAFLKQAQENGEAVRHGDTAILFECRDARTAGLLGARKELKGICLRAGETTLVVRESGLAAFRKQARALGFGIR